MRKLLLTIGMLMFASSLPTFAGSVYDVVPSSGAITVDGDVTGAEWDGAQVLEGGFHYPWESIAAPRTSFRAVADADTFYFSFVVEDADVVVLDESIGERETVDAEDRVELFFAPTPVDEAVNYALPTYYAVEVDPAGRVHDYSMIYYRQIDSDWALDGFIAAGKQIAGGYSVEASIPLDSLRDLGLLHDDGTMRTGAYRAEFSGEQGDLMMQWISWVDPETVVPDFHVEESFGVFRFVN